MHEEQRDRAKELLNSKGVQRALFANPASVIWLTGFTPPVQLGSNPLAGGPPLVWYENGQCTLVVMESLQADAAHTGLPVVTYPALPLNEPPASARSLAENLRQLVSKSHIQSGRVGFEEADLPVALYEALLDGMPSGAELVKIDRWLIIPRLTKTGEELQVLRRNFDLTGIGHAEARRILRPGMREIDVWNAVHAAIQQAAGRRVPLGNDCVVSYRQNNIGGWPEDLEIHAQDSLILDLSVVADGYWSDSCGVYYAGPPTERQAAVHHAVRQVLDMAVAMIQPGAVAREIDREMRRFVESKGLPVYPHHSGHGVGVTGHEEPRIVPYNDMRLQPGMVIMLEPGVYIPGEVAVRLEDAVLVTGSGAELLTAHDKSLPA